jgi:SAM-dependent methyltransferase
MYREVIDYGKECDILERIFAEFSSNTVKDLLDVACGTGTHALIFADRGYTIVGIDASKGMIDQAKMKINSEKMAVELFVQDMRKIELNRKFDCAICMFGGFGYVLTFDDLNSLLLGLNQHIKDTGLFIFEFWNIGGLKSSPYRSWKKIRGKNLTIYFMSESNFDPQTNILSIDMHFIVIQAGKHVETFDETHKIRCYSLADMRQYLENCGFNLITAYDWEIKDEVELRKPRKETFRILAIAKKNR